MNRPPPRLKNVLAAALAFYLVVLVLIPYALRGLGADVKIHTLFGAIPFSWDWIVFEWNP
jgi:hypothetical protein